MSIPLLFCTFIKTREVFGIKLQMYIINTKALLCIVMDNCNDHVKL